MKIPLKAKGNMTLVINTVKHATYKKFEKVSGKLPEGQIHVYDTANIYSSITDLRPLKPSLLSYLVILWRERPKNIVVTYDGSRSRGFYFNIALFTIIALALGRQVNYYSYKGASTYIASLTPLGRPFKPLFLIRAAPYILLAYARCFFSPERNGRVMGFNKFFAPPTFWYETIGKKQLEYGCWGYCYIDDFGTSQRERFYSHYLSYGYLLNKFGPQRYYALATTLFLTSFFVTFIVSGNWVWGIILLPLVLLSPYYTFPSMAYAKPENIAWFLMLPAFYCALEGYVIPLAVLLLCATYLSFTMFFFTSAGVVALLCAQLNPFIFLAFVPAVIKLALDAYPLVKHRITFRLLLQMVAKKGVVDKRYVPHRYGIRYIPIQYIVMLIISIILVIIQVILHVPSWPVTAVFILLFSINFQFFRIADQQTFYRFFLSTLLFCFLPTTNIFFPITGAFILLINPKLVDECRLMGENDPPENYPPVEKTVWKKEQDFSLDEFTTEIQSGSRVLFEYSGLVGASPYRNILSVLEAKLYDRKVELLPHETTFSNYPYFSYDLSCQLSPEGDMDILEKLLESCSISYVIVFSKTLVDSLGAQGYQLLSEYKLDNFKGFIHADRIPTGALYLLYCGRDFTFCNDPTVLLERYPNRMIVKGVHRGGEYLIHHTYHRAWRAYQAGKKLAITDVDLSGIPFMRVTAQDSQDILMKFGRINHILR